MTLYKLTKKLKKRSYVRESILAACSVTAQADFIGNKGKVGKL